MALFESYERRIDKINGVLAQYGISSVEECRELCQSKGFDPYEIVKGIQPICFENACWAYTVGAAIALKAGVKSAAEAAKMIGVNRCIIAFQDGAGYTVMLNPKILQKSGAYETEEGCLSLTGVRPVKRWKRIKIRWQNEKLEIRIKTYTGWTAEIIQHEIDHCEGILI